MLRKLFGASPLPLVMLAAAFFAGFFAQPVLGCSRVNATCSYDVQGYRCTQSSCPSCAAPCC